MAGHRYWRFYLIKSGSNAFSAVDITMRTSPGGSNVATGGTASATQSFSGTSAANAFDGNTGTMWSSNNTTQGQVLAYDFGSGNIPDIVEITWRSRNDGSWAQAPTSFIVQYSDDGTNYFDSWYVAAFGLWSQNVTLTFTKPATGLSYRYWRNWITASAKGDITGFAEISFTNGGGSNLLTGGTASASSAFGGQPASQGIDNNTATVWATTNSGDATAPWWWAYDLGSGHGIAGFDTLTMIARTDNPNQNQTPSTGIIQCSTDGKSYINYYSYTAALPWTTGQTQNLKGLPPTKEYAVSVIS